MSDRPNAIPRHSTRDLSRLMLAILGVASLTAGCGRDGNGGARDRQAGGSPFQTAAATREDLVVTSAATGVVEPVRVVEVKSKASGEVLKLTVESGDRVERGALLVQLDQKDTRNQLARAEAEVEVARARFRIAAGQLDRSKQLLERQTISPQEHEAALLEHANANAALVTAEIDLALARERLAETTVRAPITGVIISKPVEEGQIISSATSQVSGGTTLLFMASLDTVQVRALVDEIDVGRIHAGQEAKIRVDAHPEERFAGRVLKIEPQAVVEQNVTTFPVLVRIPNAEGLLLPGMNCEVEIEIHRRDQALVVPNEAVRTPQEARQTAAALGLEVAGLDQLGTGGRSRGTAIASPAQSGGRSRSEGQAAVVFLVEGGQLAAHPVRVGVQNWDETEVLSGLDEGQTVAVMPSTSLLREQATFRQRVQQVGSVPGLQRQPDATSTGGGGAGSGGAGGGGTGGGGDGGRARGGS